MQPLLRIVLEMMMATGFRQCIESLAAGKWVTAFSPWQRFHCSSEHLGCGIKHCGCTFLRMLISSREIYGLYVPLCSNHWAWDWCNSPTEASKGGLQKHQAVVSASDGMLSQAVTRVLALFVTKMSPNVKNINIIYCIQGFNLLSG